MLADSSSLGLLLPPPPPPLPTDETPPPPPPPPRDLVTAEPADEDELAASLVKRSDTALSCSSDGSWMCTSGSRTLGCMIISTVSGCSTRTGMSWVMTFSRSRRSESSSGSWWKTPSLSSPSARAAAVVWGPPPAVVVVWMVMESTGTPSRLVRRRLASLLLAADRSARWSGPSGSSRLIVLAGSADWMW